jgi:hypothetical protein
VLTLAINNVAQKEEAALCIHLYVTICMKLDHGMHIGLHLVFFGKTGVT